MYHLSIDDTRWQCLWFGKEIVLQEEQLIYLSAYSFYFDVSK